MKRYESFDPKDIENFLKSVKWEIYRKYTRLDFVTLRTIFGVEIIV